MTNPRDGSKLRNVVSLKENIRAWMTRAKRVVTFDRRPMAMSGIRLCLIAPVLALAGLSSACGSKVVIATWTCSQSSDSGRAGSTSSEAGDFEFPWSTGFEDGFCGYQVGGGFCFRTGISSYQIVTSPVHTGKYAAAFSVTADPAQRDNQVRCVRQGTLPVQAYYGAWYFVPTLATNNNAVWNLFHFAGGTGPGDTTHGIWDVSLINTPTGDLRLVVYQFRMAGAAGRTPDLSGETTIPIGTWFHIVIFLKRAADATGEVQVYLNNASILHLTGVVTDDSQWGQWYVGNLAENLTPPDSTVYVDDVTISGAL